MPFIAALPCYSFLLFRQQAPVDSRGVCGRQIQYLGELDRGFLHALATTVFLGAFTFSADPVAKRIARL
jgi:hypothetical protein